MGKQTDQVKVNMDEIGIFRQAKSKDVFEGNIVFLVGDGPELYRLTVEEVLRPNDPHKAFVFDGCRYGLDGLYVLLSGSELQSEVDELRNKLASIKQILGL